MLLTNEQIEKILDVVKTKEKTVYTILQTLYACALRKMEVRNLNLEDVNFETLELTLRNTETGDEIVTMTSRVSKALKEYMLYERKPTKNEEKALFLNTYEKRIGKHYIRNHLKECTIEAGISKRVYPHMIRASCITHLFNKGLKPLTIQQHARHRDFRTTMIYNRPTQQQMKADIERVFVVKLKINQKERVKAIIDKYLQGDISLENMTAILETIRPKELKPKSELTCYA